MQLENSVEWNIARIKAPEAWEMVVDGSGVVVGIFDSGVDYTHSGLAEKYRGGMFSPTIKKYM
jgi:bacillopeptidase F